MRKIILLLLPACLFCVKMFAQQLAVTGTVVDEYNRGLKGVVIKTISNNATAETDADGKFSLTAQKKDVLQFTYPGYTTASPAISYNAHVIVIKLNRIYVPKQDNVDVLYEAKSKDKIVGSVSTIYSNQLTSAPSSLYANALTGRLPGLYTQQLRGWQSFNTTVLAQQDVDGLYYPSTKGSKGPNDNSEIGISLRGQSPVTIVDGVQRDIYTIDPENIESISVLKDATSTILLGMRSSNGVILVTTKKPVTGRPHLSFTAQTGVQMPLSLPDPLPSYEYAYLYNEAQANEGNQTAYTYNDFAAYKNHTDPYGHPDVNWFNTLLNKNSMISRYSLNVTGGGTNARYAVGISYLNNEGLFKGSNPDYETNATLKRYTINSNIDVDVTKEFNAKLQLYARVQDDNQPGGGTDAIISQMYSTPNNAYPVMNPDGSFGGTQSFSSNLYSQLTRSGYIQGYTRDIFSNLELNYKFDRFVKGLWAKVQSNVSVFASNATNRSAGLPTFKLSVDASGDTIYNRYGSIQDQQNSFNLTYSAQYWYLQGALGYTGSIGGNNITAKVFYDTYESIFNYDLPATNQNLAASASWDYKGRYFAEGTLNYSGNDRYPKGHRFGLFYAAGLGWDLSKENFIAGNTSLSWITKLKLRASYGKTGNANVGYFSWRDAYQINQVIPTYPIGINRSSQTVAFQNTLANPDVTWEKADKFNAGIDVALFKNHLSFTADYYTDKYYNLLQFRGKQTSLIGIGYPLENLGINRYSGLEVSATWQGNVRAFNYFITGNMSLEKSKVLFSDEIVQKYAWNARTGQPVGMTFGYVADGFIQTQKEAETSAHPAGYTLQPGDIKYKDLNSDGIINQYDQKAIGLNKPLFYYGVTAGFSFKGFDVSVLFQGVANRTYILDDYAFGFGTQQAYTYIVNRWTPETATTATYPRLTPGINANNDVTSTFWLRNGNYFRIKNAEVGYTLPVKATLHLKISSVRFFVNGLNLFTHAAFDRVDPEMYFQSYPIQRVINGGVNIKF